MNYIFNYANIIQNIVNKPILDRGIAMYLEGKVLSHADLTLDNWRIYKVLDNDICCVQTPLVHLTLNRNKFPVASQVVDEVVSCSCQYFSNIGICQHIVAVYQDLQKEFFEVSGKKTLIRNEAQEPIDSSIFGQIFKAEQDSKKQKIMAQLDSYFAKSNPANIYWWEQFIFDYKRNNADYKGFLITLLKHFENLLREYDNEKKVLYLALATLRLDGQSWWEFWMKILSQFSIKQQISFWSQVWRMRFAMLTKAFDDKINSNARSLDDSTKQLILEQLKNDFENNTELWLDFVLSSCHSSFIKANWNQFDPELLLQVCEILPEDREPIEIKIMSQLKMWSDYLPVGEYTELENILTKWAILGYSDYLDETVRYIMSQHKKKPKLMSFLKKLR